MEDNPRQRKKKGGWIAVVLALLAVIVVLLLLLMRSCGAEEEGPVGYEREVAAKLGQLEGKTQEQIQAELDRVIEEGMFHVSINTDPMFRNGEADGNLEIENVPGNHYLMRVEITLDDTGELVYSTKYIEPDYHIQRAPLSVALPAGDYPATASFHAYDMETLEEVGSVSAVITLHIQN